MQPISKYFFLLLLVSPYLFLLEGASVMNFIKKLNDEARHIKGRLQFTLKKQPAWTSLSDIGKCEGWIFNMTRSKPLSGLVSVDSSSRGSESTITTFPLSPDAMKHPKDSKHHLIQWSVTDKENLCIYTDDPLTLTGIYSLKNFFKSVIYENVEMNSAFKTFKHGMEMNERTGLHVYVWKTNSECGVYNLGTPEYMFDQTGLIQNLAKSSFASTLIGSNQAMFSVQIADLTVNLPGDRKTPIYLIRLSKETVPKSAPLYLRSHYNDLGELYSEVYKTSLDDVLEIQSKDHSFSECNSINHIKSVDLDTVSQKQIRYLKALRSIYESEGFDAVRLEAFGGNSDILSIFPETETNGSLTLLVWKTGSETCHFPALSDDNASVVSDLTSQVSYMENHESDSDDEFDAGDDLSFQAGNIKYDSDDDK